MGTNFASDCGCGGKAAAAADATADLGSIGEPPSIAEIDSALASAMLEADGGELSLALATLDQDLTAEEEFSFAAFEATDLPTLDSLIAVAERYPGLKITLSY